MMSWQEAGTKTEEGVRKLQEGIDNLLAFMAENKTAADNPARWRQLDSLLDMLESATAELRNIRNRAAQRSTTARLAKP